MNKIATTFPFPWCPTDTEESFHKRQKMTPVNSFLCLITHSGPCEGVTTVRVTYCHGYTKSVHHHPLLGSAPGFCGPLGHASVDVVHGLLLFLP